MARIDPALAPVRKGRGGDEPVSRWSRAALGAAAGLTQFGVNLLELPPGGWSANRHWHSEEDEFVLVIEGEVVLVTEAGETVLRAGDCAGFKAGVPDAHHLQNRSDRPARVLEVGTDRPDSDVVTYPELRLRRGHFGEEAF